MKLPGGSIFGLRTSKTKNGVKKSGGGADGASFLSSSDGSTSSSLGSRSRSTPRSVLQSSSSSPNRKPPVKASPGWSSSSSRSSSGGNGSMIPAAISVSDMFGVFDLDGDVKITRRELETVFRRLGPEPPTDEELALMLSEMDYDGDGCISLEEVGGALVPSVDVVAASFGDAAGTELEEAFAVFDADGDGMISAEELLGVFMALGDEGCSINDCRRMIAGVDSDGDGFVCYKDFTRMMDAAAQR